MTLQELLGELQTIALAYPDTTTVMIDIASPKTGIYYQCCADAIAVDSTVDGVSVLIKATE